MSAEEDTKREASELLKWVEKQYKVSTIFNDKTTFFEFIQKLYEEGTKRYGNNSIAIDVISSLFDQVVAKPTNFSKKDNVKEVERIIDQVNRNISQLLDQEIDFQERKLEKEDWLKIEFLDRVQLALKRFLRRIRNKGGVEFNLDPRSKRSVYSGDLIHARFLQAIQRDDLRAINALAERIAKE